MGVLQRLGAMFGSKPPTFGPAELAAARECVDALMLHHGCDWKRIELTFDRLAGKLVVAAADVALATASRTSSLLALDPALQLAQVSRAFGRLEGAISEHRPKWNGTSAICTRDESAIELVLCGARGEAHAVPKLEMTTLAFGNGFVDELARIESASTVRQKQLDAQLVGRPTRNWDRINDPGHLHFTLEDGRGLHYACDVLGSYSRGSESWCWAWANSSFSPAISSAARSLADRHQLRVFELPGFSCQEALALPVAILAAHHLGERGAYCFAIEAKGTLLYFALGEPTPA